MKLRPNIIKTGLIFLGSFITLELLFYLFYIVNFNTDKYLPETPEDFIFLIGLALFSVFFFAFSYSRSFYYLEKDVLAQVRLTKELKYRYDEIIYVDEAWTMKSKTLRFVTNKGKTIYMMMDRQGILLQEVMKRSKNRLSEDEFKRKYPNFK